MDISQVTLTVNAEVDTPDGRAKVQAVGDEIKRHAGEGSTPKKDWAVTVPLDRLEEAERAQNRFTNAAGADRVHLAVRRRHRHHEHHAGDGDRADARDRHPPRAGAKQQDITLQFLVEAVVQTTIGGLVRRDHRRHIGVRTPGLWDLVRAWGWFSGTALPAKLHVPSIFLSLIVSIVVGVLFGLYPARRAAKLDPIEALRHE